MRALGASPTDSPVAEYVDLKLCLAPGPVPTAGFLVIIWKRNGYDLHTTGVAKRMRASMISLDSPANAIQDMHV